MPFRLPTPSPLTAALSTSAGARSFGSGCGAALLLALPSLVAPLSGPLERSGLLPGAPEAVAAASRQTTDTGRSGIGSGREAPVLAVSRQSRTDSDRYRITPERRALLNTIRYAEGTWLGGRADGYRVIYGGGLVPDLARHPEITVRAGYTSAAAGAYQFLPGTWREAARTLGLPDFSPGSQDQAALYLIEKRGVLSQIDRNGLCNRSLARLAPEWASLPSWSGQSYYGQPVKDAGRLLRFYARELGRQRDLQAGRILQA